MPDVFVSNKNQTQTKSPQPAQGTPGTVTQPQQNPLLQQPVEHHIHLLSQFCQNPVGLSFQSQDPDEQVLLLLRRHFITNLGWILTTLILLPIPQLVALLINFSGSPFTALPGQYIVVLILFYYLIVFAYVFISFITWFYNISLITTKRIVDISFSDVIYKNVAETKLDLVQDVDYTQIGVFGTIFDYGTVVIHTSGNNPNFDFIEVPKPAQVTAIIENLIGRSPNVP